MFKNRSYCGQISNADTGKSVELAGWVYKKRDLGGIIFIELRDISGSVQLVIDTSKTSELSSIANTIKSEYCIFIQGSVSKRSKEAVNTEKKAGDIEIISENIIILNESPTPPIPIEPNASIGEDLRLKYRYLDLRREDMRDAMIQRHNVMQCTRKYLSQNNFFEIETPLLNKSTPEGARDYLVPSRMNTNMFYALPQSPQLFKQILMVSGFDRYFQIAKCFRDEDLRNDRQPEFTQIDIEMSFVTVDMIIEKMEGLLFTIMKEILSKEISVPFNRITYDNAMDRFGKDAPDTRFAMELLDCSEIFSESEFNVFTSALFNGGIIKGIAFNNGAKLSRKSIDEYSEYVKVFKAKGLPFVRHKNGRIEGGISKFLSDKEKNALKNCFKLNDEEILFFACDKKNIVNDTLGNLRIRIANDFGLIDENIFNFLWVTDFPLLEYNEEDKRYYSKHHPFTCPNTEDIHKLDDVTQDSLESIKSQAYDVVLNGVEIGGGSIRISNTDLQKKIFSILGISEEEAKNKFSFLLEALQYGAPPHGGIAFGLDRIMMILLKRNSIRDVISFPKTTKGQCLMSRAPSFVSTQQLDELSIKTK